MTTNNKRSSSTKKLEFPTANRLQARRQLELLGYNPEDRIYLRFFYPTDDPRKNSDKGRKADRLNWQEIETYQRQGRGVYFVINGGGHKNEDVTVGRAIFCEHDHLDKDLQRNLWQTLNLPVPTFQTDTGGKSIHSFWVFDQPPPIADWCELQRDLLDYADADRSIKNPSRVMRLAGCWHITHNQGDPITNQTRIISESGCTYTYSQLRNHIPSSVNSHQKPTETQGNGRKPPLITDEVPLYQFLTKDDRALIDVGAPKGTRNSMGAKLARNLIGTAQRLDYLGILYSSDPYQLFLDYCQRCPNGDGWNEREWEAIWKSAQLDNPTASLTDEALNNCAIAWQNKSANHYPQPTQTQTNGRNRQAKINALGFEASELFDKIQAAKTDKLNGIEVLTYAGAPNFAAKLAQSADVMNVDPFMIWAYDAPASLSLLPSHASVNVETHQEPAILNSAIVVESGEGKTRAANLVLSHLRQLEKQARQQYESELTAWKQKEAAAKKEKEIFTEPPPRLEKAIAEVATVQALLRRLHGKERGLLWARDELKGLFSSLGQFCKGESEDREITLQFWDGAAFTLDRVKMEDSFYIDNSRVSIVGGIQPGMLAKVFTDPDDSQGMAARFLFHVPLLLPYRRKTASPELADFYPGYFDWIKNSFKYRPTFSLSDDAQELFDSQAEKLFMKGRHESTAASAAWYKKTPAHLLRLALPLHLHTCYENPNRPQSQIGVETIQAALFLIDYYAKAFLLVQAQLDSKNEAMILEKIQQKALKAKRPLSMRDIYTSINTIRALAKDAGIGVAEYTHQLCQCLAEKGLGGLKIIRGRACYEAK